METDSGKKLGFEDWQPYSARRIAAGEYEMTGKSAQPLFRLEGAAFAEWIADALNAYSPERPAVQELVSAAEKAVQGHCPNENLFCGSCSPLRDAINNYKGLEGQVNG